MLTTINYKYGLEICSRIYCWKDKKLYRIPFNSKLRWYPIKELKETINHSQKGYTLAGAFYNFETLKRLTKEVNYEINEPTYTPF